MNGRTQFVRVEFSKFKAFKSFAVDLREFNILVGPNNAGKSTILVAFRILAAAMRRASARKATLVRGPHGVVTGHDIDLKAISIAEENIFYNYDDTEAAFVRFYISNGNKLTLYFPEQGRCVLIPESSGRSISSPSTFRKDFDCPIGFVPILGPVEHNEPLYEQEAARLALFNYRAARNFRNIWHHYPDSFEEFRTALVNTWPGMDIERPEVDTSHSRPLLRMYCPEERVPRELFWSGFGFQVWCQMLTHLIQSKDASIFLIDEPDIYLHSELQRQLLALLRNLGPDIVIATHSTEIITEAESDDILIINKKKPRARRIKEPSQIGEVFSLLGSNINPILTQLAKTRRALFVEGKDFQVLGRFARRLGSTAIANRRDFAVVPLDGFNPERMRSLKVGMETTLGAKIVAATILDRDYRSDEECAYIKKECVESCEFIHIHNRKEIENFFLSKDPIDRAILRRLADRLRRSGGYAEYEGEAYQILQEFCLQKKGYVFSQYLAEGKRFARSHSSSQHESQLNEHMLEWLEQRWTDEELRLMMVPGKDALAFVNSKIQPKYGVSLTPTAIVEAMTVDDIPSEMRSLVAMLEKFTDLTPS